MYDASFTRNGLQILMTDINLLINEVRSLYYVLNLEDITVNGY